MTDTALPTGITIALGSDPERSEQLAATLAAGYGIATTRVRVETPLTTEDGQTAEESLAQAIAAQVPSDHLLVVESEHADRWRSRHSVTEHLIDAHRSATVVMGPSSGADLHEGPIMVALDGSEAAQTSLVGAGQLSSAVKRPLLLVNVAPDPLDGGNSQATEALAQSLEKEAGALGGASKVVKSNDPVSALAALAAETHASFIVLASSGDRETKRSTMSRTSAGLIAEATCPVFVTRSAPR